jgi:hypothetical protein
MVDQILLLFQALFLVLLYLFIWRIVRTASRDLRVPQESFILTPSQLAGTPLEQPPPPMRLVVEASPAVSEGSSWDVGAVPLTIGRLVDGNAIALPHDEFVSSHHARVEALRDGLWVVDLGSRNGTYVNGSQVDGRTRLHAGDVLRIGQTELRVAS